jgi:hypothetical protein
MSNPCWATDFPRLEILGRTEDGEEGGRRKEEGGRRKEEGGRRKEEEGGTEGEEKRLREEREGDKKNDTLRIGFLKLPFSTINAAVAAKVVVKTFFPKFPIKYSK